MKRLLRSIAFLLALTAFFGGAAAAEPRAKTDLLTNARIIGMLKAGVSEATILSLIKQFPDKLDSGPEALVELRAAGAGNKVLLAVRSSALAARQEEEPGPGSAEAGQAAEAESGEAGQEESSEAADDGGLYEDGKLSLGLGYPFLAVKYDFSDYSGEGRFITRNGVQAFAARGYWNFHRASPWTAYTGLEAGYVRYGSAFSAGELSPFIGGALALDKNFSLSADFSPTLLFLPGGGTHFGVEEIGWVINFGVFIRLPTRASRTAAEADGEEEEDGAAAAERRRSAYENSSWRLTSAPAKVSYQDYLAAAEEFISRKNYAKADQAYARALAGVSARDARRVFLFERRGWVAMKEGDLEKARDLYLAGVSAAREAGSYDAHTVNAYSGLAYCFEQQGNFPLAIKYYERALDISSNETTIQGIEKKLRRLRPGQD